jgi:ribonuclease R
MQGDAVLVSVEKVKDDGRAEAALKVLERRNLTIVGQFKRGEFENASSPTTRRSRKRSPSVTGDDLDAAHDSIVNVEVTQFPHGARRLRGRRRVARLQGDFGIDVEIMIRKHQIPVEFPAALRQAEAVKKRCRLRS